MKRMHPGARSRGFGIAGVLILLAIIGIALLANYFNNQQKFEEKQKFHLAQATGEGTLARYYIEATQNQSPGDPKWQTLLVLMSSEDRDWLQFNAPLLAGLNPDLQGREPASLPPEERMYYALAYLLNLNKGGDGPIVVEVQEDTAGRYAVAYVHPPDRIKDLRELYLINETGEWKIRRFLGARDNPEMLNKLIAAKKKAGMELTANEKEFIANSAAYTARVRADFLGKAGLKP